MVQQPRPSAATARARRRKVLTNSIPSDISIQPWQVRRRRQSIPAVESGAAIQVTGPSWHTHGDQRHDGDTMAKSRTSAIAACGTKNQTKLGQRWRRTVAQAMSTSMVTDRPKRWKPSATARRCWKSVGRCDRDPYPTKRQDRAEGHELPANVSEG